MELVLLGGFLFVVAGSMGALAGKRRDGESENARIARVLALAAGMVAVFVYGLCFARSQLSIAGDGGLTALSRWLLVIPVLLLLSLRGGRSTYSPKFYRCRGSGQDQGRRGGAGYPLKTGL